MKIELICTGNMNRSIVSEFFLKYYLQEMDEKDINLSSSGVMVNDFINGNLSTETLKKYIIQAYHLGLYRKDVSLDLINESGLDKLKELYFKTLEETLKININERDEALKQLGFDLSLIKRGRDHTQFNPSIDLILYMDESHLEPLSVIYPQNQPKIEMLAEFATGNIKSIDDPFCNGVDKQIEIYEEINNYVLEIIKKIK